MIGYAPAYFHLLQSLDCDLPFPQFFSSYTTLILSTNYVTKRQSLKLLGEILLDRANFNVMTRYIANEANLKMMMNLLRDHSKNIQFEAFHVFKVSDGNIPNFYIHSCSLGFCCQSKETPSDRNNLASKPGQTFGFLEELPQRQGR